MIYLLWLDLKREGREYQNMRNKYKHNVPAVFFFLLLLSFPSVLELPLSSFPFVLIPSDSDLLSIDSALDTGDALILPPGNDNRAPRTDADFLV